MGVYGRVNELTESGETIALVTVTEVTGSAPRSPGTSMIVRSTGDIEGTIGGGTVEHLATEAALEAIESNTPCHKSFELRPGGNTGMVCDGTMDVFINILHPNKRLVVVGGGHIAIPVIQIANILGYSTYVIEDRESYAEQSRFPESNIIQDSIDMGFDHITLTTDTAVVIATRSSTHDRSAANIALHSEAFYVGCVASDSKADHIRDGLESDDVDPRLIDQLRSPIGLNLGADTPAQIALSILSEVEAVRTESTAEPHSGKPFTRSESAGTESEILDDTTSVHEDRPSSQPTNQ